MNKPKKKITIKAHPRYTEMIQVANEISDLYKIPTVVSLGTRATHSGVKEDICILIPFDSNTGTIKFFSPLKEIPFEKISKFSVYTENVIPAFRVKIDGDWVYPYPDKHSVEEVMEVSSTLKKNQSFSTRRMR